MTCSSFKESDVASVYKSILMSHFHLQKFLTYLIFLLQKHLSATLLSSFFEFSTGVEQQGKFVYECGRMRGSSRQFGYMCISWEWGFRDGQNYDHATQQRQRNVGVSVLEEAVVRREAARGKYRAIQRCTALRGPSLHFTLPFPLLCPLQRSSETFLCVLRMTQ